jgi:hypothetical protein
MGREARAERSEVPTAREALERRFAKEFRLKALLNKIILQNRFLFTVASNVDMSIF